MQQDEINRTITSDVIEQVCNAIVDSPQLYPYFMELDRHGLWSKCTKMAGYITTISNKKILTPADTEFLKKIHHGMNISETTYDDFTRLFAHICCRNKSDAWRKKMLSTFSLLKAHVCPVAGSGKNYAAFCQVISHLNPVDWKKEVGRSRSSAWLDSFTEPSDKFYISTNGELSRSEVWNDKAQYFHLRKRLRKCQKLITVIQNNSKRMEMRIAKLEEEKKVQMMTKQKRDLDLVCN